MSADERRAWLILVLCVAGWAAASTIATALGPIGALIGYGVARLLPTTRRRGQLKYWRGQRFFDDE